MSKRIVLVLAAVAAAVVSFLVGTPGASAQAPLTCDGTYSGGTYTAVTVRAGDSCELSNVTVLGSVVVNKNANFTTCDTSIAGSVNATKAYVNMDNSSEVGGSITLTQPGVVMYELDTLCMTEYGSSAYASYLCPHYVGGSINVLKAPNWWLELAIGDCGEMQIGGSVNIEHNREFVYIEDATVVGALICVDNNPPAAAYDTSVGGARIGCPPVT
jgi:hypothetical protein